MTQKYYDMSLCTDKKYFKDFEDIHKTIGYTWIPKEGHQFLSFSKNGMFHSGIRDSSNSDNGGSWYRLYVGNHVDNDLEVLYKIRAIGPASQTFTNSGPSIFFNVDNNIGNRYELSTNSNTSVTSHLRTTTVYNYNGSFNTLESKPNSIPDETNKYNKYFYLRARKTGSQIRFKVWFDGQVEPDWLHNITNSTYTGKYACIQLSQVGCNVIVPFISIGTNGDSAPMTMEKRKVIVTLKNPNNTVAANTLVRLYLKETGALIEEQLTNENGIAIFLINVYENQLVTVVGVDENNNEWKPPIHEVYPVLQT